MTRGTVWSNVSTYGSVGALAGNRPGPPGQGGVPGRVEKWRGGLGAAYLLPALSLAEPSDATRSIRRLSAVG